MIQLTKETKTIQDSKFLKDKSTIGNVVDNSIYLVIADANNLALRRGKDGSNFAYYGCVESAIKRSLNYAIKESQEALSLELMLQRISDIAEAVKGLKTKDIE